MGLFGGISKALFGDSTKDSMKTLNRTGAQMQGIYQPYIDYGNRAMPTLEDQYSKLLNNPQALYSMLAGGYEQSPGYGYRMQAMQNAANQAASAGGMLGTNQHQMNSMNAASGIAGEDFNNYLSTMLGLYGTGLEGTQNQFNTGANMAQGLAGNMGALGQTRANLQYQGQNSNNQMLAGLGGAAMTAFSPMNMAISKMLQGQMGGGDGSSISQYGNRARFGVGGGY